MNKCLKLFGESFHPFKGMFRMNEKEKRIWRKVTEIYQSLIHFSQWQSQDFSLEGAKLKKDIKCEINLKNINQK